MTTNIIREIKNFIIRLFRIFTNIKLIGLMAMFAYVVVILFTWMIANFNGYTYFSAGEPIWWIKYPEWILATNGLYWLVYTIKKEIDLNNMKFNIGVVIKI